MLRLAQISTEYVKKAAPAKYHELIIPTYRTCLIPYENPIGVNTSTALGCRRIVRDQGYLQSLSRPNVRLTFDNITYVEPAGIITETGLYVSFTGRQSLTYFAFSRRKDMP